MPRTWLLLLGSNLDTDENLRAALTALHGIGVAAFASSIVQSPAHGGAHAHAYFNALVTLESGLDRAALVGSLKRIEHELGRVHGSGRVAIDIDLLACHDGTRWLADAHAVAKDDLAQPPTPTLLREAGIVIQA